MSAPRMTNWMRYICWEKPTRSEKAVVCFLSRKRGTMKTTSTCQEISPATVYIASSTNARVNANEALGELRKVIGALPNKHRDSSVVGEILTTPFLKTVLSNFIDSFKGNQRDIGGDQLYHKVHRASLDVATKNLTDYRCTRWWQPTMLSLGSGTALLFTPGMPLWHQQSPTQIMLSTRLDQHIVPSHLYRQLSWNKNTLGMPGSSGFVVYVGLRASWHTAFWQGTQAAI